MLQLLLNMIEAHDSKGENLLTQHLDLLRRNYGHANETLCNALEMYLPTSSLKSRHSAESQRKRGVCFDRPKGGYFVWIRLPDIVESSLGGKSDADAYAEFARLCRQGGVAYQLGRLFSTNPTIDTFRNYARLSFAHYSPENIKEGILRLATAISKL